MNFVHNNEFVNGLNIFNAPVGENNIDLLSFIEKTKSYVEEYKYNLSLAVSKFKLNNAAENKISENFFFNVLIETGKICGFIPKLENGSVGVLDNVVFQPFVPTAWNFYAEPEVVDIVPYYESGVTLNQLGLQNRQLRRDDFEIVYLNNTRMGFQASLAYEARMCAMLDICMYNNVLAKSIGIALQGKNDDLNDMKQLLNKILNQNGILAFDVENKPDVNELITTIDLNVEWLGDKIYDAKKNLRAELHERMGITHAPYEKRERLTNVEIQTQNQSADMLAESTLDVINAGLQRINEKFDLEYPLSVSFTDAGVNGEKDTEVVEDKEVDVNVE